MRLRVFGLLQPLQHNLMYGDIGMWMFDVVVGWNLLVGKAAAC